jgi:hypothetical protein
MEIKIKDNCLSDNDYEEIKNSILPTSSEPSNFFPWFYSPIVTYESDMDKNNFYFIHNVMSIYNQAPIISNFYDKFIHIINLLDIRALIRIRAILYTKTTDPCLHGFHLDYPDRDSKVAIFYLNTNNGWTEFEDGRKVNSVGNRLVTFPNNLRHSSVSQTDESARVVINFNYF